MMKKDKDLLGALASIFLLSGFSALIYQISWQRLLYTGFGVDLTSITIIVSAFMLGLGAGAFMGGRIADAAPKKILKIFCGIEILIAVCGLVSFHSIKFLQSLMIDASLVATAASIFGLMLIPTFLMGCTLPLLTSYFNKILKNVGQSIGSLYFVNTLGACLGALATGFVFFKMFGIINTIYIGVMVNILVAVLVPFVNSRYAR